MKDCVTISTNICKGVVKVRWHFLSFSSYFPFLSPWYTRQIDSHHHGHQVRVFRGRSRGSILWLQTLYKCTDSSAESSVSEWSWRLVWWVAFVKSTLNFGYSLRFRFVSARDVCFHYFFWVCTTMDIMVVYGSYLKPNSKERVFFQSEEVANSSQFFFTEVDLVSTLNIWAKAFILWWDLK